MMDCSCTSCSHRKVCAYKVDKEALEKELKQEHPLTNCRLQFLSIRVFCQYREEGYNNGD